MAASVLFTACDGGGAAQPVGTPPPPPSRPGDGLLRDTALQALVELQEARDGRALAAHLSDPDARVRARAAFALASVQDTAVLPALLRRLDDDSASVRADAAFAVGRTGGEGAGAGLLAALAKEGDATVRRILLRSLGMVGTPDDLRRLLSSDLPEKAPSAPGASAYASALAAMGVRGVQNSSSVAWLAGALTAPDPEVRLRAGYFFAGVAPADPWASRAEEVRSALDGYAAAEPAAMYLVTALGTLGSPEDAERVVARLRSASDWRIRVNAARALAAWRNRGEVRDALLDALDDPSTSVAVTAAGTLATGLRSDAAGAERVEDWVRDHPDRWRVDGPLLGGLGAAGGGSVVLSWLDRWPEDAALQRAEGLEALAYVSGPRVDSILFRAARSERLLVSSAALGSLARRWRVARRDSSLLEPYYRAFEAAVRSRDPGATMLVLPPLLDPSLHPFGSVGLLVEAYRSMSAPEDLEAMTALLNGLGGLTEERDRVEPVLRSALESPEPQIRSAAASALSSLTGRPVRAPAGSLPPTVALDWETLADLGPRPRLVLDTDEGRVEVTLDTEEAPLTVQTIAGFARDGHFDDVPFHRVVPNFVVQGGDFVRGDGLGTPGFAIRTELTRIPFGRGVIGMASAGKDTEGSQYFLTHSMQPHLDAGYTAFGWVSEGMGSVDRIAEGERVRRARVVPDSAGVR